MTVGASPVEKLPIVAIYGVTKNRFKNYKLEIGNYPLDNEVIVEKSIFDNYQIEMKFKLQIKLLKFLVFFKVK